VLHADHVSLEICKQHDLVFQNVNKVVSTLTSFLLFHEGLKSLFYQSAWGRPFGEVAKARLTLQVENFFVLLVVQNKFVLSMLVHDASLVDV
jgi:hypothetical protein